MTLVEKIKKTFPTSPGCYLMKDFENKIIYIGKARNLKKRVLSYFQKKEHDPKTQSLITQIDDLDFIATDNETEALILEAKLIRDHRPKYNIDLKDSIRYGYIKITKEEFPRLLITRQPNKKEKFFGPYPSGKAKRIVFNLSNQIFKLRVCAKLPAKACLLYHLGQCSAPCIKKISATEYQKQIKKCELFLLGKNKELIKKLTWEMKSEAKKLKFEKAQTIKEQILAIQNISIKQKMDLPKLYDQNVINFLSLADKVYFQVFAIKKGVITAKEEFNFANDSFALENFIKQYYFTHSIPNEIILPQKLSEQGEILDYLQKIKNNKIKLTVPGRGYKKDLLKLVYKNIELKTINEPLIILKNKLNLETIPNEIDCFDISNISGKFAVGSCVRFSNKVANKNWYRHFKIKTITQIDDFASLREIIFRRYRDKINLPNLIMIDGGLGQLSSGKKIINELGLKIDLISLAKKEEEIYCLGSNKAIKLDQKDPTLHLLQQIRDEAHRFAITYHRKLRGKNLEN